MFDKMLYRDANIYMKGGLLIKGFIKNIDGNFMEVEERSNFELTIINLDEIMAVRGQCQNVPHDEDNVKEIRQSYPAIEETSPYYPFEENWTMSSAQTMGATQNNPVRIAAKVSKRPNDFSMQLPTNEQDTKYQAPTFVRETDGSNK